MRLLFLAHEHYHHCLLTSTDHHFQLYVDGKPCLPERAFAGTTVFYAAAKVSAGTAEAVLKLSNRTLLLVLNGQHATRWAFARGQKHLDIPPFAFFAALVPGGAIEVLSEQGMSTVHCMGFSRQAIPLLAAEFSRYAELAAATADPTAAVCTLPHRFLPYTIYKYLDRLNKTDKRGFALNIQRKEALYQAAKLYHTNLTASQPAPRTTLDEDMLHQAKELIQTRFADPTFDVNSLARDVGMSRRNLYRLFENQGKSTPQKLILHTRLERAQQLLKNTDHPVGDVATKVGFNHPSYFSTQYKAHFGHAPHKKR